MFMYDEDLEELNLDPIAFTADDCREAYDDGWYDAEESLYRKLKGWVSDKAKKEDFVTISTLQSLLKQLDDAR
jgi:hypothetical protein